MEESLRDSRLVRKRNGLDKKVRQVEGSMPRLPDETDKRKRFQSAWTSINWSGSTDTDNLKGRRSSLLILFYNLHSKYKISN